MKTIKIILIFFILSANAFAQNEADALRYSNLSFGGTARFTGMGGAFGALGADFSTLSFNPAGIGLYKKSEITFTPSFYISNTSSLYQNNTTEDSKLNLNVNNFGAVFSIKLGDETKKGWRNLQFGIGMNRTQNFNNRIIMEGDNPSSSLITEYIARASGSKPANLGDFNTGLAYDAYLMDPTGDSTHYTSVLANGGAFQRKSIESKGAMSEVVISLGGNYNDRLYIGATLGIVSLKYTENSIYSEKDNADTIPRFNSFSLNDHLETSGSGINFKVGLIFRATDWLRLGAAVHTPTYFYNMEDNYYTNIKSDVETASYSYDSPKGSFIYTMTTPFRAIGSIAFIVGPWGLISADYEYVNYSDASIHSETDEFVDVNQNIREGYRGTGNIRVGTEWSIDIFKIRGGFAYYGSPYKNTNIDASKMYFTGGFGFRQKSFFADFTYVYGKVADKYYLYDANLVPPSTNTNISHSVLITCGVRF
ncbi:MAG: hypothetical protein WCH34_00850 [Bacteroidota bacterium]